MVCARILRMFVHAHHRKLHNCPFVTLSLLVAHTHIYTCRVRGQALIRSREAQAQLPGTRQVSRDTRARTGRPCSSKQQNHLATRGTLVIHVLKVLQVQLPFDMRLYISVLCMYIYVHTVHVPSAHLTFIQILRLPADLPHFQVPAPRLWRPRPPRQQCCAQRLAVVFARLPRRYQGMCRRSNSAGCLACSAKKPAQVNSIDRPYACITASCYHAIRQSLMCVCIACSCTLITFGVRAFISCT